VCCLSGVRAPEDVDHLILMPGSDDKEYPVSKQMLDKYSRQLYVYGIAAMARMMNSSVLVSGISGTGVEIAKNVILAGVKSFTVHDTVNTTYMDLASNFFLTENDIGKNRASVCLPKLREFNKFTPVSLSTDALECTKESIGQYTVVVLVDYEQERLEEIGNYCHENDIIFIATGTYGLYGYAFSDFGKEHNISDTDGVIPRDGLVVDIKPGDEPGTTKILTEEKEAHGLWDKDEIKIAGFSDDNKQWKELLEGSDLTFPITRVTKKQVCTSKDPETGESVEKTKQVTDFQAFQIPVDTSSLGSYSGGSVYYNQVKPIVTISHLPFSESIKNPDKVSNMLYQYVDFNLPKKMHYYLLSLWEYQRTHNGQLPPSGSLSEAEVVVNDLIRRLKEADILQEESKEEKQGAGNEELKESPSEEEKTRDKFIRLCLGCRGKLNPMATIFGGIVGQEVMKGCSGKYTPLNQMFHFEDIKCSPINKDVNQSDMAPANNRYDGLAASLGKQLVNSLHDLNLFMVGAGALGCELMKNFAMCGIGTNVTNIIDNNEVKGSGLTVTDMDVIENSNLCRQFLFREWDVRQEKSKVAVKAGEKMNSEFHPTALTSKVAPETASTYDDNFWMKQNVIVNALDNVKARQYVDSKCTFYGKPLLESGTKGVVANVQPIIPNLTQCYNDVTDPPDPEAAPCTIKSFPYKVVHTIQWAKSEFAGAFEQNPIQVNQFIKSGSSEEWVAMIKNDSKSGVTRLRAVHSLLVSGDCQTGKCTTIDDCVRFARLQFEELFANKIKNLLHQHPPDKKDEDGRSFWSGDKKLCAPAIFDVNDADHFNFLKASTHLCANLYRIDVSGSEHGNEKGIISDEFLRQSVAKVVVPDFVVDDNAEKIPANEDEAKKMQEEAEAKDDKEGDELIDQLSSALPHELVGGSWTMMPEEFEKDDDTNWHMDFITATSNLRCANYDIRDSTGKIGKCF
jgi:ubiquitin-activating enzyme E1